MTTHQPEVEIRLLGAETSAEMTRLAQVDSAPIPPQPLLGGIVAGRLVAAHSLATGESIADPFQPTGEIRSLLAQRARQLRDREDDRGLLRRLRRRLAAGTTRRARGISAPSIPGSEHTHLRLRGF